MLQRSLEVGMILESGESGLGTSLEEMKDIWLEVVRECHSRTENKRTETKDTRVFWSMASGAVRAERRAVGGEI